MTSDELRNRIPDDAYIILTSRSSGPGGQNINKVNTKVEIRLNILHSAVFSDKEKELIYTSLKGRINAKGELIVRSQAGRTQLRNKNLARDKILKLISDALTEFPERKATKPTLQSRIKRLEDKSKRSIVKKTRKYREEENGNI